MILSTIAQNLNWKKLLEISDMMKFRNFGKKSLTELEQLIEEKGLTFGMDVSKYRLDED
jgi:DNA-directed RNA polymerase subunit alpha